MKCYRDGGCGPYENRSCSECPASKPEYAHRNEEHEEKELLSKHKHIFAIKGGYDTFSVGKFPVIYINKSYVYFRINGNDHLSYVCTSQVQKEVPEGSELYNILHDTCGVRYFWSIPDDLISKKKEYIRKASEAREKEYRIHVVKQYKKAKRDFEMAEKKYLEIADDLQDDEKEFMN